MKAAGYSYSTESINRSQNQYIYCSLNSEVTSKYELKKITIQPQIKSGICLKKMFGN